VRLDVGQAVLEKHPGGGRQGQLGRCRQLVGRDAGQGQCECGTFGGERERQGPGDEQPSHQLPVLRLRGMPQPGERLAVLGEPSSRPDVQAGHLVRRLDGESMVQRLPQQGVVAVPRSARAQANDEGVGGGQ